MNRVQKHEIPLKITIENVRIISVGRCREAV